ncbi:hypothetical protein BJX63DRAFT_431011 [Aspergillus granulosus]|uniref:Uncharacterized protein n=1 Tax=Aspergillus granulosus TaxID=176169 RepID=A0ABR4HIF5_9EURO
MDPVWTDTDTNTATGTPPMPSGSTSKGTKTKLRSEPQPMPQGPESAAWSGQNATPIPGPLAPPSDDMLSEPDDSRAQTPSEEDDTLPSLLRRQLAALSDTVETCISALDVQGRTLGELERKNATLHDRSDERQTEIDRVKAQLHDTKIANAKENEIWSVRVSAWDDEKREFERLISQKDDDMDALRKQLDAAKGVQESLDETRVWLEEARSQAATRDNRLQALQTQQATLETKYDALKEDAESQKVREESLKDDLKRAMQENAEIRDRMQRAPSSDIPKFQEQLNISELKRLDLEQKLRERDIRLRELESRVLELEAQAAAAVQTREQTMEESDSKSHQLRQESDSSLVVAQPPQHSDGLSVLHIRITDLESQNTALGIQVQELSGTNHAQEQRLASERKTWEDDISMREERIEDLRQDLDTERSRANRLKAALAEKEATSETLKRNIEVLEKQVDLAIKAREEAENQQTLSQTSREERFVAKVNALRDELRDRDRQISDLHARVNAAIDEGRQSKDAIEKLQLKITETEYERRQLKKNLQLLTSEKAELESERLQLADRIKSLSSEQSRTESGRVQALQQSLDSKDETIKVHGARIRVLEKQLTDIQEFAFALKRSAARRKADDSYIRDCLEYEFRAGTRHWAKTWGATSFGNDLDSADLGELRGALGKVLELRNDTRLLVQLQAIDPRLVADALLSRYLVDNTFLAPTSSAHREAGSDVAQVESALSKFLIDLYKAFIHVDETKAQSWREQTLHLFYKSSLGSGEQSHDTEKNAVDQLVFMCDVKKLAEEFLVGPVRMFLKPASASDHQTQIEQLMQLLRDTGRLCLYIRQQYAAPQIRGFEFYGGQPFRHDSPEMQLDRYHRMEADDASRNGDNVRMVTKPGFFAPGVEGGKVKVWAKAAVLLP